METADYMWKRLAFKQSTEFFKKKSLNKKIMYQYNLNDLQLIEKMLFKHMPGDSLKEKKKKPTSK